MPTNRTQQVWLSGEPIGRVTARSRTSIAFEYNDDVLERYPLNTPLLSCSLPTRRGKLNARAFMAGLLPEGEARRYLAEQAGCLSTDVFALLDAFGKDVAGAVWIGAQTPTHDGARAIPYAPQELENDVLALPTRPLAIQDDSALSIAGIQNKMVLIKSDNGSWARPIGGFPSTHILKIDDQRHAGLVRAEHACLELATAAGITAARSEVTSLGGIDCIIVERFDRTIHDGSTIRIHQEDACQALGYDLEAKDPRAKYESHGGPTLSRIAKLLSAHAQEPQTELLKLLDQVTFTVAIGNADHHAKNVSMMHTHEGVIALAPLYDTVPTTMWPNLGTRAAMSIGAAVDLPDVTATDLLNEARRWGVPETQARPRLEAILESLVAACTTSTNTGELDVVGNTRARTKRLLDSLTETAT